MKCKCPRCNYEWKPMVENPKDCKQHLKKELSDKIWEKIHAKEGI